MLLPSLPSWLKQLLAGRQEAKDPFNPKGWSPICFQRGPKNSKMAQGHSKGFFDLKLALELLELRMKELESSLKEVPLDARSLGSQFGLMLFYWREVTES